MIIRLVIPHEYENLSVIQGKVREGKEVKFQGVPATVLAVENLYNGSMGVSFHVDDLYKSYLFMDAMFGG